VKKAILFLALLVGNLFAIHSQTISIDSSFTTDAVIYPFYDADTIYGLQLSGNVRISNMDF